jgi:pimeloyl-ACP methyl ester carboxylesterase
MSKIKTLVFLAMILCALGRLHAQVPQQTPANSIVGNWEGVLSIGETKLRLIVKVTQAQDSSVTAVMDSIDQPGANNLTINTITFQNSVLHFEMKALQILYDGTLSKSGSDIVGTFTQGGVPRPLVFRKAGSVQSNAIVRRGSVQLKACNDPSLSSDALCGKYEVFEDRVGRKGRKIGLNLMVLPATGTKVAPDPLFYLAGGPGGAATSYASESYITALRQNRDVVLLDQRGTGQSNPLNCPLSGSKEDMSGFFGEVFPVEKLRACRAELEKVADLKLYTSAIAMDDMDEVRAALGYDQINVYGGSYGSTTALVYLRQHGAHVRSVAIFGVAPPAAKIPLSFAKGVQDSMNRLFADCAAEAACHKAYPDVEKEFKTVIAMFDKGPVEVTAGNVYTGAAQKMSVTRDAFVDGIRQVLYVPAAAAALPALIHLGAQGNLGPLVGTAFQIIQGIDGRIARGMQFSVICAEDVPFITEEDIKRTSANSFYGDARVRPTIKGCAEWPQAKVAASFLDPVKSDVPVLLVSGALDPVTPPWLAETVAQTLPRSRLVIVPNATHSSYECVEKLVASFIDKGTTEGLDASCVQQIKRPPFAILGQ